MNSRGSRAIDEALVRFQVAARVGLNADDPALVPDTSHLLPPEDRGSRSLPDTIVMLYSASNWLWGRLELLNALAWEPFGDFAVALLGMLDTDSALADVRHQFAHSLADDMTFGWAHTLLASPHDAWQQIILLGHTIDAESLFAEQLWHRDDLADEDRAIVLLNLKDQAFTKAWSLRIEQSCC